jgi:hypothetical protein
MTKEEYDSKLFSIYKKYDEALKSGVPIEEARKRYLQDSYDTIDTYYCYQREVSCLTGSKPLSR